MPDLDPSSSLPRHIAIIMDGNGRWAHARGLSRTEGHRKGAEAAQDVLKAIRELKIPYVTLFAFSSENWNRPEAEIRDLMELMRYYLRKETAELHKSGARIKIIGQRDRLPDDIQRLILNAENVTRDNRGVTVQIALSYGGRDDIVTAAKSIAENVRDGKVSLDAVDEVLFDKHLMTSGVPDPDLLIRTSGESRISNFLLWQCAYSEFYFTDTLWPDFNAAEVLKAIAFFQGRERRYGGLPHKSGAGA